MSLIVSGTHTTGIKLTQPGQNPVVVTAGGAINATGNFAIYGSSAAAWTVVNDGSLSSRQYGVTLANGGAVINGSATDTAASISGGPNIYDGIGAVVIGGAAGSVANFGKMTDVNFDVYLVAGGSVTNGSAADTTATMSGGHYGIVIAGTTEVVTNYGTIADAILRGVDLRSDGTVINGTAIDTTAAILATGSGSTGVTTRQGGTVTNYGTISGGLFGVDIEGGRGTVTNAGTIIGTGGTAVQFAVGGSRLIVDPGAVFVGKVVGGSGSNTLELASAASAGTISGLGFSFTNFGTIVVDQGAAWTLTGNNTLASSTFDIGANGTLLVMHGSLQARGGLVLHGGSLGTAGPPKSATIEVGSLGHPIPGGLTVDPGVTLSGFGRIVGGVRDNGTILATGGTLSIAGKVFQPGTIAIAPHATFYGTAALYVSTLRFLSGGSETLQLGVPSAVNSTISGFGTLDTIDLVHAHATSASFSDHVLSLFGPVGSIAHLNFRSTYAGHYFNLGTDHRGGTVIGLR